MPLTTKDINEYVVLSQKIAQKIGQYNNILLEECIYDYILYLDTKFNGNGNKTRFICRFAKQKAFWFLRKQKQKQTSQLQEYEYSDKNDDILDLVRSLPSLPQHIIYMKFWEGYTNIEISNKLKITKGQIDYYYQQGLQLLKDKNVLR